MQKSNEKHRRIGTNRLGLSLVRDGTLTYKRQ